MSNHNVLYPAAGYEFEYFGSTDETGAYCKLWFRGRLLSTIDLPRDMTPDEQKLLASRTMEIAKKFL